MVVVCSWYGVVCARGAVAVVVVVGGGWLFQGCACHESASILFLSYIPANMAEEEVAKLTVGNDSGMCKASFAGDVPRMFSLIKNSFCV